MRKVYQDTINEFNRRLSEKNCTIVWSRNNSEFQIINGNGKINNRFASNSTYEGRIINLLGLLFANNL